MNGRLGLIASRYRSVTLGSEGAPEPATVVELFGRMDDGRSVCVLVHGQRPTFEIAPIGEWKLGDAVPVFLEDRLASVRAMEHVVSVSDHVEKWTELGVRPVWTVEAEQPFHVPQLRKTLQAQSWRVFSGDIPFVNRLLLDGDLGMHIAFEGDVVDEREHSEVTHTDVIAAGGSGRYPVDVTVRCDVADVKATEPFAVPFRLFSFDLETSIEHETVLCAAAWVQDLGTGERTSFSFRGDEGDLLEAMTEVVRLHDPDIITGYNIDNFDLPRLVDRAKVLKREQRSLTALLGWGRVPQEEHELTRQRDALIPRRQSNRAWNLAGRAVMDTWWQARQALRPRRESLAFVASLLFPDDEDKHKMDVDASQMDKEWAARPDTVMEYCVRDAALPLDILDEIQIVRRKEAVASVAHVTFETAANGSTSQLIDSLVIRWADRHDVAVPLTGSAEAKVGQITGGYVHDVEAGLHPWIAVLDFKSMYPSIMIGKNICYTTRVDPAQPDQPEEGRYHRAPTDARFRLAEDREGMVPALLKGLMAQRDEHKASLRAAKASDDEAGVVFHDAMQYAVKILMNSFYGVFASGFYRFTHRDLGSSITAWARQNIKTIIQKLEQEGHHVVYSDTDSIFVCSPVPEGSPSVLKEDDDEETIAAYEAAKQAMIDFGLDIAKQYSRDSAVLEYEKGLSVFFSHGAKKRYVGQVVYPSEEMLIRGYETQRTDSFEYLTTSMKKTFTYALADEGDALVQHARECVAALKKHEVDARRLILAKSCKGRVQSNGEVDFSKDYARPESMAQVRAAMILIERGLGFTPGMKISYVVTDASKRPMQVHPWIEAEDDGGIPGYDGRFYAERLAAALGRITEAFGWNAKELFDGNRQTTLFSF